MVVVVKVEANGMVGRGIEVGTIDFRHGPAHPDLDERICLLDVRMMAEAKLPTPTSAMQMERGGLTQGCIPAQQHFRLRLTLRDRSWNRPGG